MNKAYTLTGGARIGNANATYPFADLYVDEKVLKINASILGNLVFQPKDIISIKPRSGFIGKGIEINHRVPAYKDEIIFWTFKKPIDVIREIEKTGFLENTVSNLSEEDIQIIAQQQQGSFPLKKSAAIFFIVAWNALFLIDVIPAFLSNKPGLPLGIGMNLAVGLIFFSILAAIMSEKFRDLILKEGRDFEDIRKFTYFAGGITGLMLLVFTVINLNK